jgi:IS5 family transposase
MQQTKKGKLGHFPMNVHTVVVKDSELIHAVYVKAASLHDIIRAAKLLHGKAGHLGRYRRSGHAEEA